MQLLINSSLERNENSSPGGRQKCFVIKSSFHQLLLSFHKFVNTTVTADFQDHSNVDFSRATAQGPSATRVIYV